MRDVIAIDASYYQQKIDGSLLRSKGVELAILKADVRFPQLAADVVAGGLPLGAYAWSDPTVTAAAVGEAFARRVKGYPVRFAVVDFEQWWADWGAWYQAVAKKISLKLVKRCLPQLIARRGLQLCQWLQLAEWPVVVYTSRGFVQSYAPQANVWLRDFDLWVAHYGRQPAGRVWCSWEDLRGQWLPRYEPLLPAGYPVSRLAGHQFTGDRFQLPGIYKDAAGMHRSPADVSVFDRGWFERVCG